MAKRKLTRYDRRLRAKLARVRTVILSYPDPHRIIDAILRDIDPADTLLAIGNSIRRFKNPRRVADGVLMALHAAEDAERAGREVVPGPDEAPSLRLVGGLDGAA